MNFLSLGISSRSKRQISVETCLRSAYKAYREDSLFKG